MPRTEAGLVLGRRLKKNIFPRGKHNVDFSLTFPPWKIIPVRLSERTLLGTMGTVSNRPPEKMFDMADRLSRFDNCSALNISSFYVSLYSQNSGKDYRLHFVKNCVCRRTQKCRKAFPEVSLLYFMSASSVCVCGGDGGHLPSENINAYSFCLLFRVLLSQLQNWKSNGWWRR